MNARMTSLLSSLFIFGLTLCPALLADEQPPAQTVVVDDVNPRSLPKIHEIIIKGNKHISTQAIERRLPYKKGDLLDPLLSSKAIQLLYSLGFFRQVQLETENVDAQTVRLFVLLKEKLQLKKITVRGYKAVAKKKILETIGAAKLTAIDHEMARRMIQLIKKLYRDNNYHMTTIKHELITQPGEPDKALLKLYIKEGPKSTITRVLFAGNHNIPDRKLSGVIFTREEWLLGILSDAGKLDKDHLDMDKHRIEYFYRDHGYFAARVVNTNVEFSKKNREIHVTFEVNEGEKYTVGKVRILGDDVFTDEELEKYVYIHSGDLYQQKKLVESITSLKSAWGKKGYINADVYPDVRPNEENKTVDITFRAERGEKMYVNRIDITGNKYTRDKVIRREISFEEGDLITSDELAKSQGNVEFLSYWDRGGVNWKIHRITEELADLEMNVQEGKTGSFSLNFTYGSDKNTSARSLRGVIQASKKNLLGRGWDANAMLQGRLGNLFTNEGNAFQKFQFGFFNPYLFDTNISGGLDAYLKHEIYEQWRSVDRTPVEDLIGFQVRTGFMLPSIDKRLQFMLTKGVENIEINNPTAIGPNARFFQPTLDRTFQDGLITWLQADLMLDSRNHKIYPTGGFRFHWSTKWAPSFTNSKFSFIKSEIETSWFMSLIDEDSLVLGIRARAGMVRELSGHKVIPYRELFHMGGQSTVRGFVWGSIGPAFLGDPVGGRNMVLFNTELTFPLLADYSMKAHVFYDAGAGWDTPKQCLTNREFLTRDKFKLRHAIGFGLNIMYPQPIKIDWGYKLDRIRKNGESASEWHISMNMAW